jgi:peroxiredoxin
MQRLVILTLALVLVAAGTLYSLRAPLRDLVVERLTADMFVSAAQPQRALGPAIGSHFPGLRALHEGREITLLDSFAGPRGTVLVASRSLVWCPYCMAEMRQLQEHKAAFDAAGIGLVAITYDSPTEQQAFASQYGITIPLLSDLEALSFKTLGILHESYRPGDEHYGIPHPGMIVVAADGTVAGTLFLEGYSTRVAAAEALAHAEDVLGPIPDR